MTPGKRTPSTCGDGTLLFAGGGEGVDAAHDKDGVRNIPKGISVPSAFCFPFLALTEAVVLKIKVPD